MLVPFCLKAQLTASTGVRHRLVSIHSFTLTLVSLSLSPDSSKETAGQLVPHQNFKPILRHEKNMYNPQHTYTCANQHAILKNLRPLLTGACSLLAFLKKSSCKLLLQIKNEVLKNLNLTRYETI